MKPHFIGDVHLGKKFETGVPLHRRGDRERMVFEQFLQELQVECDLNVQVGDLFDKFYVPYTVVWQAAQAYIQAAKSGRTYIVMRGNHDASRDVDRVSAFQIFKGLVEPHGVIVVSDEPVRYFEYAFIPWHPFATAEEQVTHFEHILRGAKIAVGHWDVVMGDTNRLPAEALLELGIERAITGHDHLARELKIADLPVTVTGSMQPYSHSEDPDGKLYVTRTLADLDDVTNKCVRLLLGPDEVLDEMPDCLQLQIRRGASNDVDLGDVDFEEFDLHALYSQAANEVGLDKAFAGRVLTKLEEARAARG